ncbi:MAG: DNA polymerase III subunit beta [Desulfonatronovibrio sp.]
MYLRVFREDIINGITKSANIISHKTGAAYLRTLWIKAEDQKISIMSTDSNMEFIGRYDSNILETGLVGVEGRKFNDLLRKLKPGEIIFKADHEKKLLFIQQDKRRYKIPTSESSWFPELSPFPEENLVLWSGEEFKEIIDKLYFSISDDDSMGYLTCMYISRGSQENTEVEFCGFNIQNLSLYTIKNNEFFNLIPEKGILIPKKYLVELRKWLGNEEIEISISNDRFFIRTKDLKESISFPLSFEEYTDYHEILDSISGELKSNLLINRKDLMDALDRILIFSTEFNKSAVFELQEEEIRLDSTAVETGEANEILQCKYQGDVKEVVFNIKNMLDILGNFHSEEISISLAGQVRPCKITGELDPNYFVITMPVQIKEETYYTEEEEE